MSLKTLNFKRNRNFILIFVLVVIFTICLYSINFIYPKNEKKDKKKQEINTWIQKIGRFLIPLVTLGTFFTACTIVAHIIADGSSDLLSKPRDQYVGIYFLLLIGVILTFMNLTVLKERSIKEYIKGKKFSVIGAFMALGVSAIVFGFLDNFGMKLGTEALDDNFVQMFLGPFSTHKKFGKYREDISENLKRINFWTKGKWRSVINHLFRCKEDIEKLAKSKKFSDNRMDELVKDLNEFIEEGAKPLIIPDELFKESDTKVGGGVREYVRNVKQKYDMIDGSKSMMGNTFSDFIGAVLGAAIINLFTYMTSYDGIHTGDEKIDNSFLIRNLNKLSPFMEAFFISIGCLIPIFLNVAITRDSMNSNNKRAWMVVGFICVIMVVMMFLSVKGTTDMSKEDKKKSINKTIEDLKERLDINNDDDDKELVNTINDFKKRINNLS